MRVRGLLALTASAALAARRGCGDGAGAGRQARGHGRPGLLDHARGRERTARDAARPGHLRDHGARPLRRAQLPPLRPGRRGVHAGGDDGHRHLDGHVPRGPLHGLVRPALDPDGAPVHGRQPAARADAEAAGAGPEDAEAARHRRPARTRSRSAARPAQRCTTASRRAPTRSSSATARSCTTSISSARASTASRPSAGTGTTTWKLKLAKGTLRFYSDKAPKTVKGSVKVT